MAEKRRRTAAKTDEPQPRARAKRPDMPGSLELPAGVSDGRIRAVIDAVFPTVDGGRFPAKRIAGEPVRVEAHCFTDGHDQLRVVLAWQDACGADAYEVDMDAQVNDVWTTEITPPVPGRYRYTVFAWVDHFESWRRELERREELNDIRIALQAGSTLVSEAADRAFGADADGLRVWSALLRETAARDDAAADPTALKAVALDPARAKLVRRYADRRWAACAAREFVADRKRAGFSSWYELFPRSAAPIPETHGSFRDVEARLPYVADMGFDVLYFPPIQPIGRVNRKGANNALRAGPRDVGSPWAIGSAEGGHKEVLSELGTLEDFKHLVDRARSFGIEIALDLAFQCAPDHPYVSAHPQWFKHRPDGSVQYAENPPKKYQDIYPFDFESDDWRALWEELKSVVEFWIAQGVMIFRVDNPHTKPFAFWEWLITEVKRVNPEIIFLAEAFTRPKVMHRLAKLGFTPVVHLFHLAQYQAGAHGVLHRAGARRRARIFSSKRLAQYPRHTARNVAVGVAAGVRRKAGSGRDLVRQLRHLWPRLRVDGKYAPRTGQRGVPRFRKVPTPALEPRASRQPVLPDRPRQSHPPR